MRCEATTVSILAGTLVCASALLLAACGAPHGATAGSGPSDWPRVLRYSVSIAQENPEAEAGRLETVRVYLQRRLGMPVEIQGTSGYGAVIEALRARKIEASSMGPFAYLLASEKANVEAIVSRGTPTGEPRLYSGTLAVAGDSRIRSLDDLIKHSKELTISFVDPASASGYLVERAYLESIGIVPERDFKKVVFTGQHMTSAFTLVAGKVDVAALGDTITGLLIHTGKLREGQIRTLWSSPKILEGPVAVRKDLPEGFKRKLRDALVEMASKAPEAYLNMSARIYRERYKDTAFVPVTDAMFDPLRALARGVTQVELLEH